MNRWIVLGLSAVILLAGVTLFVIRAVDARRPKGPDDYQLRQMLTNAAAAASRRDSGGVARYLSADYSDTTGLSATSMRYQIARYLREHAETAVEIPDESITIQIGPDGRTGTVEFRADISARGAGGEANSEVRLSLRVAKERVHYLLFFPGEEWRVTSADGYSGIAE